jgi:hypothetical protein
MQHLQLTANDEVSNGGLDVSWAADRGTISPLGLTFSRYTEGNKYPENICGFNMSRDQAKKLAKFIIENL